MQEAFYTNSYPADKDANSNHVKIIRLLSVGTAGFSVYVIYTLISHLYEYVTTIHREPDEVLLLSSMYTLGLVLMAMITGYGYHFATQYTERTPENYAYLFKFMNITFVYNLVAAVILHKFSQYHVQQFNMRFAAVPMIGAISLETQIAMTYAFCVMKTQIIGFAIYYFAWRSLYKKELTQPKIVDTIAAGIKFVGTNAKKN
jgi:hypothetical protein